MDAISLSCCWEATLLCPPVCCLIQPAQVGALPWVVCVSAPQKHQLYLGTVSALQLHLQVKGAYISPPSGAGHQSDPAAWQLGALLPIRVTVGVQLQALFPTFQGEPFSLSSCAPELTGSGVCKLAAHALHPMHPSCPL